MRALPAVHPPADDAFGVLHRDASLPALHEDDDRDDDHRDHGHEERREDRELALADELQRGEHGVRQLGDDAREDDHGDAVPDATLRHLLAQPHDEGRTGRERDHGHQAESPARLEHHAGAAGRLDGLETGGDEEALHERERDRPVARVLRDLAPPDLAFLGELLEVRDHHGEELQDDARADVRHDAEREDREALQRAAREQVHQAEKVAAGVGEELREGLTVDARRRYVAAQAVDGERAGGEADPLAQLGHPGRTGEALKHRAPPPSRPRR